MRKNMFGIIFILGFGIVIITFGDVMDRLLETEMLKVMANYYQSLYQFELSEEYSQAAYFFDLVRFLITPMCLALFLLIEKQITHHMKMKSKTNLDEHISYMNRLTVLSLGLWGIFYIFSMIFIMQQFIPHVYFKVFFLLVTLVILLLVVMYGDIFTQNIIKCENRRNENPDQKFNNPIQLGNVSKIIVSLLLLLNTGMGIIIINRYIDYRLSTTLPDQLELSKDVSFQVEEKACFIDTLLVIHCTDYYSDLFNNYTIDTITYDINNEYAKSILKEQIFSVSIIVDGVRYQIDSADITINEGVDFELVIDFTHYISNDMKEHGFNRLNIKWTNHSTELALGDFQQGFLGNFHIKLVKISNLK